MGSCLIIKNSYATGYKKGMTDGGANATIQSYVHIPHKSVYTTLWPGIAILYTSTEHAGGTLRLNSATGTIVCSLYEGGNQGNYTTVSNGLQLGWYKFSTGVKLYYDLRGYGENACTLFRMKY